MLELDANDDVTQSLDRVSNPQELARLFEAARLQAAPHPERIGPYKVLQVLGEGGMGVVYLVEQTAPVHRRVALKIIKLGMDTKQTLARFETEREALALMNHPNVAKVFDAGSSETGRPYFVMEYVPGIPITEYCDKQRLNTEERLHLFMDVCHAVQHAHQKGIIHRDIKPSNVLVSVNAGMDGAGSASDRARHGAASASDRARASSAITGADVKVIDFGVAKATQHRLTERTLFTEQGQLIGTPGYMSPEQAEMTALDIDTRTDIYSLGVLLYELLVGARPFDEKLLRSAGLAEIQRIIREVDPPKPSTKLSALQSEPGAPATGPASGDARTTSLLDDIAKRRQTEPRTLLRQIRGDLDWIVMNCLEKDRTRRYDTANGLALEIERYLNNEPVLAGPPSAVYRLRKFARRHRGVLAAVSLVLLGTTGGMVWALWERDHALAAKAEAEQARDESDQVTWFLRDMLAAVDPRKAGKDLTVRAVLDQAAVTIGEKFKEKPLTEARLRHANGSAYLGLGLLERAEAHLSDAATICRRILGEEHPDTLAGMHSLAVLYSSQGRPDRAEPYYLRTLEMQRRLFGEEHWRTMVSMNSLGALYMAQGRYNQAEILFVKILASRRRLLGESHPDTIDSMHNLASVYFKQSRYEEAEALMVKTVDARKLYVGKEHPNTLESMNSLAVLYATQNRYEPAEQLHEMILAVQRRGLGEEHPDTLRSMNNLAVLNAKQGRLEQAESLYIKTLDGRKRVLGEEHPETLDTIFHMAALYDAASRFDDAESLYVKTLEVKNRLLGAEHRDTLRTMAKLANLYTETGRFDHAEPMYLRTLEATKRALGEDHYDVAAIQQGLAILLQKSQRFGEAEVYCRQARTTLERKFRPGHRYRFYNDAVLGMIQASQSRFSEAESLLLQSYEALKSDPGLPRRYKRELLAHIARLYDSWDAAEPGKGYADKAAEWRAKLEEEATKARSHEGTGE